MEAERAAKVRVATVKRERQLVFSITMKAVSIDIARPFRPSLPMKECPGKKNLILCYERRYTYKNTRVQRKSAVKIYIGFKTEKDL